MKMTITATRTVEQTKTIEIDVDDGSAKDLLDPKNAKFAQLWAEQQVHDDRQPWVDVPAISRKIDIKWK